LGTFLTFLHILSILDFPDVSHPFLTNLWENQGTLGTNGTEQKGHKRAETGHKRAETGHKTGERRTTLRIILA